MIGQVLQAVLLGGYCALTAAGLTFMLQVMRVILLAHRSVTIVVAYVVYTLAFRFGINPFVGLVMVLPVAAAVGWALQRLLLARVTRGELLPILSTFGLDQVMFQIFGANANANAKGLSQFLGDLAFAAYDLPGGIPVGKLPVWILLAAILVLGGLHLMLTRTGLGRRIRATAIDPVTAGLVGADARQSAAIASAIAMMMVAMAGVALGFRTVFDACAGGPQLLFAFEATIIGGARSLWGVFVGVLAWPISLFMLRLRGGEFSIGMWVLASIGQLCVKLAPMIQGETGASLISLNACGAFLEGDISTPEGVQAIARALPGRLDALCNVAGVSGQTGAAHTLAVNFCGLRSLSETLAPTLREGGSVVNLASIAGYGWRANLDRAKGVAGTQGFPDLATVVAEFGIPNEAGYPVSREILLV